jgi:hypothetical protein
LILGAVAAQVDITLEELADMLHQEHGLDVAPSETGASTKMARAGSSETRPALPLSRPARLLKNHHFHAALRLVGMTAPMVINGPMNRDAFHAYVRQLSRTC